jgi:F-type H+-transporting ATPase subunit b
MPQLSQIDTFLSQIFWLFICFSAIYFFISTKVVPEIGEILKKRQNLIDSDLDKARNYKSEAEKVEKEYLSHLATARAEASANISEVLKEIESKNSKEMTKVDQEVAKMISESEKDIYISRDKSLKEIDAVVADLSKQITKKLLAA